VLLVTGGTVIEYPPELYASSERAREEAERWAWVLSGGGWAPVDQPFEGRWTIADKDVRLVPVEPTGTSFPEPWIGTFWTEDGYPDPEAVVLDGRDAAADWVSEAPPGGEVSTARPALPWLLTVTHRRGDDESYSVVHRAKVLS
jgi:hypothetical protein